MKRLLQCVSLAFCSLMPACAQTLSACQEAAVQNYPLIRQYGLAEKTAELTVANVQKGWLPQLSAVVQATWQSDVTAFPEAMQQMYRQMGIDMKGLKKDQYRAGIDVQQTVFDGGAMKSRKTLAWERGNVEKAQTAVTLYTVRKRVNEMFFALLLTDEQIRLNSDLQQLLAASEQKLAAMLKSGTASESDYNAVRAERLGTVQQAASLQFQRSALARLLSAFCGIEVNTPVRPVPAGDGVSAQHGVKRPELRVIDAQLRLADAQEKALDAGLLPKVSLFAQTFYGYPGYNMFEDMMRRRWSLNGMLGARLTWNIGSLYTRKNDRAKIGVQREAFQVQRETFLFNNRLDRIQQDENIARYRKLMADDEEIISLRSSVRKAAESKLAHGIIDVNDLLKEINTENAAMVQHSVHEIEMLKEISNLEYVIGKENE